jgi:predicted N-acetyltransferase YhbS
MVRDADVADLERVASVLYAANCEFESVLPSTFFQAYLASVLDIESRREAQLLVAEHDGRVVGTITLYPDASREGWGWPASWAGIRAVAVEPSARGLGIGRRLAEECVDRARALGAAAVCLHTAALMAAARTMYERVGFRRAQAFDRDAGELFGVGPIEPQMVALAYRFDLTTKEER